MGNSISGTYVQVLTNDKLWIESTAVEQLHTTAKNLTHIRAAVGLPDLHPGRGYPVGAAFFAENHLYPALVGGDIGCGMSLYELDIQRHKTSGAKLAKKLGMIDEPIDCEMIDIETMDRLRSIASNSHCSLAILLESLGTIGGGNHFAEIQEVDTVYEAGVLNPKHLMLMVHSGSRGMGGQILREHIEAHGHGGLVASSQEAAAYLEQHMAALEYAVINRAMIAKRVLQRLRLDAQIKLDISHNLLLPYQWRGMSGYLHRKGAAPADAGLVVIPGSRGDFSYVVRPMDDAGDLALHSLAHGAGRKWARTDCKGRLSGKFSLDQLSQSRFDSVLVCKDRELIYEEAPQAYKDINEVIEVMQAAGLIKVVARVRPVLTYKKGDIQCC